MNATPSPPARVVALVLDGNRIAPEEPAFLPLERGLLYGDGLFESLLVVGDCAIDVDRHFARMAASASALGLPEPAYGSWNEGIRAAIDVVRDRPIVGTRSLRITWTRGAASVRSYAPSSGDGPPRLLVALYEALDGDSDDLMPRKAVIVPGVSPGDLGRHKTLSAMAYVVAQARANALGADEALLVDAEGRILEAAGSNVFVYVAKEGFYTPPLTLPILPGIMRERVFEWLGDVYERLLTAEDLHRADEVFLTNAVRGIIPIGAIDGHPVGRGYPGDMTVSLYADFFVHGYKKMRTLHARKTFSRPASSE